MRDTGDSGEGGKIGRFGKLLIVLMCSLAVSYVFRDQLADVALKAAAEALNRKTPAMMGDGLRLDGVASGPEKHLLAYLTLTELPGKSPVARRVRDQLIPSVREGACTDEKVRLLMDYGLTLKMTFSGSDGVEIFTTVVDAATCTNAAAGPVTTDAPVSR